jgi:two-component system phosphate regulon sensor histidine kinase PhoR
VANPITNKAFWWASGLLAVSGIALSLYAVRLTEAQWTSSIEARARAIAQSIERDPQHLAEIVAATDESVTVYDSEAKPLANSRATRQQGAEVTDLEAIRAVLQDEKSRSLTGETIDVVLPIGPSGRPAAVLQLTHPAIESRIAVDALRSRMLRVTGLFTVVGMSIVGLYLTTADRRLRQQRQFVENVLAPAAPATRYRSANDDEITALARSLRELPPRLDGLNRQAQGELAQRELILKTMSEGVVAVSRDMQVTFCNDNFAKFCGPKNPLPIGQHILTVVRSPEFLNVLTAAVRDKESHRIRVELNGRQLEVQASVLEAGGASGAIAVLRDITELVRLERVRRDFITNISHELRTPLAAIQGYAETLLEGEIPTHAPERGFLETIHRHATRLSRVAADLATLSEIENPSLTEPLEPVSIRMVVASAARAFEREAEMRQVKLIADDVPDVEVQGQRLRLEQALVNLLDNAIRFNHSGGEVRVAGEVTDEEHVRISVSDKGIGIPSEHLSRIFERFYRVDKARSRETGGTGLGLSIVKHVAEQMQGRVQVESTLGKGTKFTLILPLTRYHGVHGPLVERAAGANSAADDRSD